MTRSTIDSGQAFLVDGVQYCNWSEKIFRQMRAGGLDAVHVTVCYHENFRETVDNLVDWNQRFERFSDLIMLGRTSSDVELARARNKTAIFFGLQNCSAIEGNIGLIEVMHALGVRVMQLSYNNQSLLASGCYEPEDTGITRMGLEVIREMNRVGMVIDMSHSGERSTIEAIESSSRPITVTHSNPATWHPVPRNKSDRVLDALAQSGGMFGLSLYSHHLKDGSACTRESFCEMIARLAERIGVQHIGIGSDLCQDQPDSVVEWMRKGRWAKPNGSQEPAAFPPQPQWFVDNRDFPKLRPGLSAVGFSQKEIDGILGMNWHEYFAKSFGPKHGTEAEIPNKIATTRSRADETGAAKAGVS